MAVGFAGLALSAVFMLGVHVLGGGRIDLADSTLSTLVYVDGWGWMFGASVLGMAAGAAGLAAASRDPVLRAALGLVAFCCVLVALFPTNLTGPLTVSAEIHRYAAGVAFFSVPVAALLAARRLERAHRRWLTATMAGTAVLLLVFLTSHFEMLPQAMQDMRGVFQRMMFALQLVLLAQLLRASQQAIRAGRTPSRAAVAERPRAVLLDALS